MTARVLYPIQEGFHLLGIGRTTGYRLVRQGRLTVIKVGRKSLLAGTEISGLAEALLHEAKEAA